MANMQSIFIFISLQNEMEIFPHLSAARQNRMQPGKMIQQLSADIHGGVLAALHQGLKSIQIRIEGFDGVG